MCSKRQLVSSEMDSIIERLKEKVNELGNQKVLLMDQVNKLRHENEELNSDLIELKAQKQNTNQGNSADSTNRNSAVEGRIDDMVKEIDKCIAILNVE